MRAIHVELSPGSTTKRASPPPSPLPSPPSWQSTSSTARASRGARDTDEYTARTRRDQYYYSCDAGTSNRAAAPDAVVSQMMEVELDAILRGERRGSAEEGRSPNETATQRTGARHSAASSSFSSSRGAPSWGSATRRRSPPRKHGASPSIEPASHSPVLQLRPPPPLSYVSTRGHTEERAAAHVGDSARLLQERRAAMQESIERFLSCGEATGPHLNVRERSGTRRTASSSRQHSVTTASSAAVSPSPRPPSCASPESAKRCAEKPVMPASTRAPLPRRTLFAPMPLNRLTAPTSKGPRRSGDGGSGGENAAALGKADTREAQRSRAHTTGSTASSPVPTHRPAPPPAAALASSPVTPPKMAAAFSLLPYTEAPPASPPSASAPAADVRDVGVLDGSVVTVQCAACALSLCLLVLHRFRAAAPPVCYCPACGGLLERDTMRSCEGAAPE